MAAADDVVVLDFADERSVVQTRFATTALTLLRAHLGLHTDAVVSDARAALAAELPEGLVECNQFTFLGRGWTVGLANEAGLKMREASCPGPRHTRPWSTDTAPSASAPPPRRPGCSARAPEGLADQVRDTGALWVPGDPRPARRTGPRPAPRRRRRSRPRPRPGPAPPPHPFGDPRPLTPSSSPPPRHRPPTPALRRAGGETVPLATTGDLVGRAAPHAPPSPPSTSSPWNTSRQSSRAPSPCTCPSSSRSARTP